ncbi:MAG: DUF1549 domain-containing protein [Pirellulaceae bacterium]
MKTTQIRCAVFNCALLQLVAAMCGCVVFSSTCNLALCQESDETLSALAAVAEPATDVSTPEGQAVTQLYARIDALLAGEQDLMVAPPAADGELLRRLSLDLRGVIPTSEELDAFVSDSSPIRWQVWVDRFLADPLCDEHLVNFLDRTLMMRRAHTLVDRASWLAFLREQIESNVPLDEFSKRILYAPWWNQENRAAQRFFLDRGGDPNLIARDIGRVFLGQDLQCAQCHDHPLVDDYKQTDYHGLVAFFTPSKLVEASYMDANGKEQKMQLYVETPAGDAAFESVFNAGVPYRSGPRLPDRVEHFEEYVLPDKRLAAAIPTDAFKGIPPPPLFSRRQELAQQLASRDNFPFVSNWANRLWALVFGQGLVDPVDMQHADNPAVHPALFALVTDGLIETDMQPRRFIAQLVLTQAYQRGGFSALETQSSDGFPRVLSTEQSVSLGQEFQAQRAALDSRLEELSESEKVASQNYEKALDTWREIQTERAAIRTELDAAEAGLLGEQKKSNDAAGALAAAEKKLADTQSRVSLLDDAAMKLQQAVALADGEDAELKQAIELSQQRSASIKGTLPDVEKGVADAKAAVDATVPSLALAVAKTQEVVAKLQPVHHRLQAADESLLAARSEWKRANISKRDIQQQLTYAENTLGWLKALADAERLQSEGTITSQSIASIEADIARLAKEVAAVESQHVDSLAANAANAETLATIQKTMERHASEIMKLEQATAALAQAAELIVAPEALNSAQATIRQELENRRAQSGELQSQIDHAQQTLASSMAQVARDQQALEAQQAEAALREQELASARERLTQNSSELSAAQNLADEYWAKVNDGNSRYLKHARLRALSPEQLCWSTLRITGQLDAHIQAELVELEKQNPVPADADDAVQAARQRQAVRAAFDKLRGNSDVFVSLYASGPDKTQDEFFASADQALFTANAGSVFAWAGPGNNNVTQRAIAMTDGSDIAQAIYWTLLCRKPTDVEIQLVNEQLAGAGDSRNTVIQEMVWGLLASAEFRFCR